MSSDSLTPLKQVSLGYGTLTRCSHQRILKVLDLWLSLFCCYGNFIKLLPHWCTVFVVPWIGVLGPRSLIFSSKINSLVFSLRWELGIKTSRGVEALPLFLLSSFPVTQSRSHPMGWRQEAIHVRESLVWDPRPQHTDLWTSCTIQYTCQFPDKQGSIKYT